MSSSLSHRQQSTLWTVIIITLSTTMVSVAIAEIFAAAMGLHAGWQHYVFALGLPAISTPIWAVPLVRANHQLGQMRAELERLARTDPLSGLPNRRAFFESARRIFSRAKAKAQPIAAMMIDIDCFKTINDGHGHDIGDAVIRAVAGAIDEVISRADEASDRAVARFGGDEFAVLVTGLDEPKVGGRHLYGRAHGQLPAWRRKNIHQRQRRSSDAPARRVGGCIAEIGRQRGLRCQGRGPRPRAAGGAGEAAAAGRLTRRARLEEKPAGHPGAGAENI